MLCLLLTLLCFCKLTIYVSSISAQPKSHLRRCEEVLPQVTSPEAALAGNDVTRSHMTGSDRMRNRFPPFFSYHSSILYPELFPLSSTTPLSTLVIQSQNHMTIITVFNHMMKTSSYLLTACFTLSSILSIMCSFLIFISAKQFSKEVEGNHI